MKRKFTFRKQIQFALRTTNVRNCAIKRNRKGGMNYVLDFPTLVVLDDALMDKNFIKV